jgi:DNA-damage-inducible protein J
MAKESTMQLRMDSEMKEQVEALYRSMGTSFAEAIRIFVAKSLLVNGLPFSMTLSKEASHVSVSDLAGSLRSYATPEKLEGKRLRCMTGSVSKGTVLIDTQFALTQ